MSATQPVAVVGAGPYGLSAAAHLTGRGVPVRVFGRTMDSWQRRMPAGMYLKSTPDASDLSAPAPGGTLLDFCRAEGVPPFDERHPVPIGVFVRYGQWFQRRFVPQVEAEEVVRVAGEGRGFRVALAGGEEFTARAVVVAGGLAGAEYLPPELAEAAPKGPSPDGPVSHSSQHADFAGFAGRRVAVIGAGQSALESAALLHEAGAEPVVLARGRRVLWGGPPPAGTSSALRRAVKPASPLGPGWSHVAVSRLPQRVRQLPAPARLRLVRQVLGPSGAWWLRDRVEGRVPIATGRRVRRVEAVGDKVVLRLESAAAAVSRSDAIGPGSDRFTVDHVLAATGYRVDTARLDWLEPPLRAALRRVPGTGSPELDPWFRSTVGGLYFVGLAAAPAFGPLMRFVAGAGFAARRVAAPVGG